MVSSRRMGNMVLRLGNATTSAISFHHMRDVWKSPRGTVLRIQALAVVAIVITFLLVAFGSCRRWSNRWIVQKGFYAAQVLSLSLGTYSIGLMQSSPVRSEMYPIWTVSLFILFGCIDPVTTYNGFDYMGSLSKMVYGIFLHCGYVLLMSISAISSPVGNTAIGVLSAITFIKGFHRSLALVQQRRMRNILQGLDDNYSEQTCVLRRYNCLSNMIVDFPTGMGITNNCDYLHLTDVDELLRRKKDELQSCYDACVAYSLSHSLQRHFLGLSSSNVHPQRLEGIAYKRALKVIEIELAFLYDVFFTGNAFLHYYQAKAASLWALASLTGICCVGVAAAIPGTLTSRHTASAGPGGSTNVVDNTTTDIVITFVILVSLALLHLMQLIRCWTSTWARLAVVCAYARYQKEAETDDWDGGWWMRLKACVATSTNWFDKYLWQEEIGQYSILAEGMLRGKRVKGRGRTIEGYPPMVYCLYEGCFRLVKMLGFDYIWEVLRDLLGSDTNKRAAIRLDDDVKASIIDFLAQIHNDRIEGNWLSFHHGDPHIEVFLPYTCAPQFELEPHGYRYTRCVMVWCIVTCYCELAEQQRDRRKQQNAAFTKAEEGMGSRRTGAGGGGGGGGGGEREENNRNRRVANALSKYCAYLVVSLPELLPGLVPDTRRAYNHFVEAAQDSWNEHTLLKAMLDLQYWAERYRSNFWVEGINIFAYFREDPPLVAVTRRSDVWQILSDVWVRMLVYAAPYGKAEAHMRQLSQGGEFITHLWTLLYHLSIREWKLPGNLHNVTTLDHAQSILTEIFHGKQCLLTQDNQAVVVAFLNSLSGIYSDELAAVSVLEKHVSFYRTTSPTIAKLFYGRLAAKRPSLVLLKKEELVIYNGEFEKYAIAQFVNVNKLPLVTTLTRKTASCISDHPIDRLIILLAVANESSKFLPIFKEAAEWFKGKLIFVFVEPDNEEVKQTAKHLIGITCTGQETTVLACPRVEKRIFTLDGEVTLDNIKKFAQDFFEDKLYVSESVPESNDENVKIVVRNTIDQIVLDESKDVLLVIYTTADMLDPYAKLAEHARGIASLVIAKMNGETNWDPRVKLRRGELFKTLFYPARRKRFEPITFSGDTSVKGLYEFIKKHAAIRLEPIEALEKKNQENGGQTKDDREQIPPLA